MRLRSESKTPTDRARHLAAALFSMGCLFLTQGSLQAQSFQERFGHLIDLGSPANYAQQDIPAYINRDNTAGNPISDLGATLGRVLFYDKELSVNRTTSCASCHHQILAFADDQVKSVGENGLTGRHSMRLVNSRFARESRFFWDERAETLEAQTTQPIQDHIEMGFSGQSGNPDFNDVIDRLSQLEYYQELFTAAFGSAEITEARMQLALAQFVRSIQSFDSKYDAGRIQAPNDGAPFPNFTQQENLGKQLFLQGPQVPPQSNQRVGGGLGCAICHTPPEFDITPNSGNNGVVDDNGTIDTTNTRSPTLRDTMSLAGGLNSQLMHNGLFTTMDAVLSHYNAPPNNPQIDRRLRRGADTQRLNITQPEREAVIAFMQTLTGTDVYMNEKWSDPFADPPPLVEETVLSSGDPSRSQLTSVAVMFSCEVDHNLLQTAFTLTNESTGQEVTSLIVTATDTDGKTMADITFGAGPSVVERNGTGPLGNSLADGNYHLMIHSEDVVNQTGAMNVDIEYGGQVASDTPNDHFFRLLGDANGDGVRNGIDLNLIIPTLFNPSEYRSDLDTNGDGAINGIDLNAIIPTLFSEPRP